MKGKKAVGPIGGIMLFMVFLVIYFVFLAGFVGTIGHNVVTENNLTGIEAFAFDNLNLMFMVCMVLGMLGWVYFGGNG